MAKKQKVKTPKYESDDQMEIKKFIWIIIILIIVIVIIYFFTRIFVTKDLFNKKEETAVAGEINYTVTSIGSMLSINEEEYYVIAYSTEDINASYYSAIASKYSVNSEALSVYTIDLNNELNKKYYDKENVNLNVENLSDLRVGDLALFKVKNGKITKTFDSEEKIINEFNL